MTWKNDEVNDISKQNKIENIFSNSASSSDFDSSFDSASSSGFDSSFGSASSSGFESSFGSGSSSEFDSSFGSASSSGFDSSFGSASSSGFDSSFGSASSSGFDSSFGSASSSDFDSPFGSGSSSGFDSSFASDTSSIESGMGSMSDNDASSLTGIAGEVDLNSSLNLSETSNKSDLHDSVDARQIHGSFYDNNEKFKLSDVDSFNVTFNPENLVYIKSLYTKYKLYNKLILVDVVSFIASLICFALVAITDIDMFGIIGSILFFGSIFSFLYIIDLINKAYDAGNILFKNEYVLSELKKYIDTQNVIENCYSFSDYDYNMVSKDNLLELDNPESVLSSLRLGNFGCNENSLKNWIRGIYRGIPFRFYEIEMRKKYLDGNSTQHEIIYSGMGYIFKTQVNLPFAIQYEFNLDSNPNDFIYDKFDDIFVANRLNFIKGKIERLPKMDLSIEELEVFKILEVPEFINALLKLAKIFSESQLNYVDKSASQQNSLDHNNSNADAGMNLYEKKQKDCMPNRCCIRLANQNLVILREGKFDYFGFNFNLPFMDEIKKAEREITEFLSVLAIISSLTLVAGEKNITTTI